MRVKERYLLLIFTLLALLICLYYYWEHPRIDIRVIHLSTDLPFLADDDLHLEDLKFNIQDSSSERTGFRKCHMINCFNFSKCKNGFKIFVYKDDGLHLISQSYLNIIRAIKASPFYTSHPGNACLFVPYFDILDRDPLGSNFDHTLKKSSLKQLPYWNHGTNHLIFNLYSGTWPDYLEDIDLDIGKAILVKASMSEQNYRAGFDVSFPLFHQDYGFKEEVIFKKNTSASKKYLLVFKGKRYLTGKGSRTRNSLFHLHNGKSVVLLTTCKHGRDWRRWADDRCETDNQLYDHFEYEHLMLNSKFCLVPCGRRLGSFRFLEALRSGCIPVILSDGWVLPFSDVVDWKRAVVWGKERNIYQLPKLVKQFTESDVTMLAERGQFLYNTYFSSVENIVRSTLLILHDRIYPCGAVGGFRWNDRPGAFSVAPGTQAYHTWPWRTKLDSLVAVVTVLPDFYSHQLYSIARTLSFLSPVERIVILWASPQPIWLKPRWPSPSRRLLTIHRISPSNISLETMTYRPEYAGRPTVLLNTATWNLNSQQLSFAFEAFRSSPDRIVGFTEAWHYWNATGQSWVYTEHQGSEFSIILPEPAFMHSYFLQLLWYWFPREVILETKHCVGIFLNGLLSYLNKQPPVKVASFTRLHRLSDGSSDDEKGRCFNLLEEQFGFLPLYNSVLKVDPQFYLDNVAQWRKKYKLVEPL